MLGICLALGAGISKSWSEPMASCCSLLPAGRKSGKIFPKLCEAIVKYSEKVSKFACLK